MSTDDVVIAVAPLIDRDRADHLASAENDERSGSDNKLANTHTPHDGSPPIAV
jgi:hypothetical protein